MRTLLAACVVAAVAVLGVAVRADTDSSVLEQYRERIDQATDRALAWLARTQLESGAFRGGNGDLTASVALAGMAFLSKGYTPDLPPYGENINRCIDYVLAGQDESGLIQPRRSIFYGHDFMYTHGIATMFLAEASGMVDPERQKKLDVGLGKALRLILDAQKVRKGGGHQGGWRYRPDSPDSDLSVSGWNLLALRSGRMNGAPVPKSAIDSGIAYVRRMNDRRSGGFGYTGPHSGTPATNGVGILCLELTGHHGEEITEKAGRHLLNMVSPSGDIPQARWCYSYGVYYTSQAMFQLGGEYWEAFVPRMYEWILRRQGRDGNWGDAYDTSMYFLCLSVIYRQAPVFQR